MAGRRSPSPARREPPMAGLGVDATGGPVIDPTQNVLDLVNAAIQRQDDLREADQRLREADLRRTEQLAELRSQYDGLLREAESKRIDAIRAVDVGAVQRAAEVQLTQASTLAAQVATSAETLRASVVVAAQAQADLVTKSLVPIQQQVADILTAIADLRRVQYEQAGQRAQVVETRDVRGESRLNVGTMISLVVAVLAVIAYFTK